ncbi:MAG: hypothetical protein AB7S70_06865 [Hyphomicrobium sp.]|uniref:hypothetical protein n=1 Tax=Hyphomicrobium sp. TaxID=82 RepID=UPI003D0D1C50
MTIRKLASEAAAGVFGLLFLFVVFHMLLGGPEWLRWLLMGVVAVVYVATGFLILYWSYDPAALQQDMESDLAKGDAGDFHLIGVPGLLFFAFLALCSGLAALYPGEFFVNAPDFDSAGLATYVVAWLLYLFDNVLRVALLDFLEVFYLTTSTIRHSENVWACALVFSFRLVLTLSLLQYVFSSWRYYMSRRTSPSSN